MARKGASRQADHYTANYRLADHCVAKRTCLGAGCNRTFMSRGPGNRKCPECAARERGQKLGRMETGGMAHEFGGSQ